MARLQRRWFPQTDRGEISAAFLMPLGCDTFIVRCRRASEPVGRPQTRVKEFSGRSCAESYSVGVLLDKSGGPSKLSVNKTAGLQNVSAKCRSWYAGGIVQPK